MTYRGRFAPTPSGDLHLGGARTALWAFHRARSSGGRFVMRVEDLDRPRAVPGAEQRILEDLRALGVDWDEGPDVGGPDAPYRQSERTAIYEAKLQELVALGLAFPCYCSRAEVARASQAPHGPNDDGPRYPGTCRALDTAQQSERARTRQPSWRFRVPAGDAAIVNFVDHLAGAQQQDVAATIGDFVLRRSDGIFAYQLAVVVDDIAMAITEVVRGEDLLSSVGRQVLLFRAWGAAVPRFCHLPLVLGPDGARLSKRHGSIAAREHAASIGFAALAAQLLAALPPVV